LVRAPATSRFVIGVGIENFITTVFDDAGDDRLVPPA
jgi:hypothetical protein